jgi:carboxypeptidase C (cathepsin A)
MGRRHLRATIGLLALILAGAPAIAQPLLPPPPPTPAVPAAARPADTIRRLPPDSVTRHTLVLPDRTLHFTATAGAVTLSDAAGTPQAQIGFIAYTLDDSDIAKRPVSFAMNGGPGSASAWLQLGLLGPWRMSMERQAAMPSASPVPVDNAETWLDFTDLVFIDPIGTGFSKLLVNTEDNRKRYYSVTGDVSSIADGIRIWLTNAHRMISPKYIVGESYSGLRGPRLARELASKQSVGLTGLVLISPKLDYGNRSLALDTMEWVAELPSFVAAARARKGPVTRADMADVEAYAIGDYASDLMRGEDPAAVARRVERWTSLTGLDAALVARRHARVSTSEFLREIDRGQGLVASPYDATVTKADPSPLSVQSSHPDPMTDSLQAPFVSAMVDIYARKLNWMPEGLYEISSDTVNRAWDFGRGYYKPESVTFLRQALATDPGFHVLIAHGLFDVLTPYFDTQLMLNQIPKSVGADRVSLQVYPGGHMFYSEEKSRIAFRHDARKLYGAP